MIHLPSFQRTSRTQNMSHFHLIFETQIKQFIEKANVLLNGQFKYIYIHFTYTIITHNVLNNVVISVQCCYLIWSV